MFSSVLPRFEVECRGNQPFRSVFLALLIFNSNCLFVCLISQPAIVAQDTVEWEEQRVAGRCGHYLKSPSSRFVDCSVRALCDHSKACEIEHKLECVLGEKVKTRSTIRPGRMGACGGGGLQPDVVARSLDRTRVLRIVQIVEEKKTYTQ